MKQFFRRHRRVITIVAAVLLTALVVGLIASMTSVFAKVENSNIFNAKERNKNNLVSVEDYISWDGDVRDGVEISVDENGVITPGQTAMRRSANSTPVISGITMSKKAASTRFCLQYSSAVRGLENILHSTEISSTTPGKNALSAAISSSTTMIFIRPPES